MMFIFILQVVSLSSIRLVIPKDLLPSGVRENTVKKISEVCNRFPDGIPLLDPEEDMKVLLMRKLIWFHTLTINRCLNVMSFQIVNKSYKKVVRRIEALESLFKKHPLTKSTLIEQKLHTLHMKKELTTKIKAVKRTMRSSSSLAFKDELKARKRVLRRLG